VKPVERLLVAASHGGVALSEPEAKFVVAKRIAERWLEKHARPEYRMTVYSSNSENLNIPSILRSFRNGKLRLASVPETRELGMEVGFDRISVWSPSKETMLGLDKWFRDRGCETTGVW
jgi:hypothetical protein